MLGVRTPFVNRCRFVYVLQCTAVLLFAAPALGQTPIPPPVFPAVDGHGVDVSSGTFTNTRTDLVIGQPGAGGLAYTRSYQSAPSAFWTHNHTGYVTPVNGTICSVVIGAATATFNACQGADEQLQGSTLSFSSVGQNTYTYTARDGSVATFVYPAGIYRVDMVGAPTWIAGYLTSITSPDGGKTDYIYDTSDFCDPGDPNCFNVDRYVRLKEVRNNFGYRLVFEYPAAVDSGLSPSKVTAINAAVEYCNGPDCTQSWPSASYVYGANSFIASVTDNAGLTTSYTYSGYLMTQIQSPARTINIAYTSGRVATFNPGFGSWGYGYVDGSTQRTTTVTNPDSTTRVYVSTIATGIINSVTNEAGHAISYDYDSANRQTKATLPEGNYTQYTYDDRGNITELRQVSKTPGTPRDIVKSASYPASPCTNPVTCNKPTSTTDVSGETDYTYDSTHGGVLTIIAPPAQSGGTRAETHFSYAQLQAHYGISGGWIDGDPVWRLTSTSTCATAATCDGTADQTLTTIGYAVSPGTPNNVLRVSTSAAAGDGSVGVTTTIDYTDWGDAKTVTGPLGATRYWRDGGRRLIGLAGPDPDGGGPLLYRAARVTYDTRGLPTVFERGTVTDQGDMGLSTFTSLEERDTVYDTYGRPTQSRVLDGGSILTLTQLSYDNVGRPSCTAVRMNKDTFASPPSDACTPATAGDAGADRITRKVYSSGQLQQVQSGYGVAPTSVQFTYTNNGQVATLTDARGYLMTYEYDGFDRLTKQRYPMPNATGQSSPTDYEQFTYDDPKGWLVTEQRRNGDTFTYTYDNLGRVTGRNPSTSEPAVSYAYDLLGRMTSADETGNTITTAYDALSRVTSVSSSVLGAVTYEYDAAGRRTRMNYPGSDNFYVTYAYDAAELTNIFDNVTVNGNVVTTTLATYAYDNLGRRTSLTRHSNAATSYVFDGASRLTSLTQDAAGTSYDTTIDFQYNPASQISQRSDDNPAYDSILTTGFSKSYTADGLNRYTTAAGVTPTYDGLGNLTGDGTKTYGYDADNRLTSSGSVALTYDPLGRLHDVGASSHSRFLYDGTDVIAEYDGSNTLQHRYVHGAAMDEPLVSYDGAGTGYRHWLLADERGSVIAITDDAGNVTQLEKYDAYGAPGASNQGRFQYTGQMWLGEVGLYHYKARAYHPALGRFMQTDPIGVAGGMNLYGYAANDPVNFVDPSGLSCQLWNVVTHERNWSSANDDGALQMGGTYTYYSVVCGFDDEWMAPPGYVYNPGNGDVTPGSGSPSQSQQQGPITNFLCKNPSEDVVKEVADQFGNVATAAQTLKPMVLVGATAAGMSRSLDSPQAWSILGKGFASGLAKVARAGEGSAVIAFVADAFNGDPQSALYDTADYVVYSNLAKMAAEGAVETLGGSVATGGTAMLLYYQAGGSRGLVQANLCGHH